MKSTKFAQVAGIMLALTFILSCSGDDDGNGGGGGVGGSCDSDKGNNIANYKTKKIGSQTWMVENLNYNVEGSKCYGEGSEHVVVGVNCDKFQITYGVLSNAEIQANGVKYGRLYDYETAKTVCPSGWHLPSSDEFTTLVNFVGGEDIAGTKLMTTSGWKPFCSGNKPANGTDYYGFSALPGGSGRGGNFEFADVGNRGYWWSDTELDASWACQLVIGDDGGISVCNSGMGSLKSALLSVRCVKD